MQSVFSDDFPYLYTVEDMVKMTPKNFSFGGCLLGVQRQQEWFNSSGAKLKMPV